MAPSTYLDVRRDGEPEWSDWDRDLARALYAWEASRCPDCGNDLTVCLWNATRPKSEQPTWVAGFRECRAREVLLLAQAEQAKRDEEAQKSAGKNAPPVPTLHRHWFVRPPEPGERGV